MQPPQVFALRAGGWRVQKEGCGVLTAATASYFPGLLFLLATIAWRVPVCVVDLGLTLYQRRIVQAQGATIIPCDRYASTPLAHNTSWLKPHWLRLSPFPSTLWLDADTIVCGDLSPLFERMQGNPLVMAHPYGMEAARPCNPHAARQLGLEEMPDPANNVNAGVLGLTRNVASSALLHNWNVYVNQCLDNPQLAALINFWDEGCLHVAIASLNGAHWIVRDRRGWDRFVHFPRADSPADYWERMPIQDDDVVIHLIGSKPWLTWATWVDTERVERCAAEKKSPRPAGAVRMVRIPGRR